MKKIDWLIILFIIFASIYTLKDLFKPGFYTSHDGIHQVVRLYYFDQAIRDGQIPPRWAGGLLHGFGYPLFIFSYQFPWFIAEPLHILGLSIFESIKMTFLIGFILSGITMYFFQREMFGRLAAGVGTTIYLFTPYRFSNIFVRAAIGDATTFIFPPLLFLSLCKLRKSEKLSWRWIILGAISLTGILLSHAMVFFFFFLSFWLYIFYWLVFTKKRKQLIVSALLTAFLSFGFSSYYFIPSIIEKNFTRFTEIMRVVYFSATFLNLKQLFYSPWGYGTIDAKEGSMSLQLGIAQWMVVVLSILTIIFLWSRKKLGKSKIESLREAVFYLLLFGVSIFLMLSYSRSFWNLVSKVILIDFTWRVLSVSVFAIAVLAGFLISQIKYPYLLAVFLIGLAVYANRNHLRINQTLDWPLSFYLQLEKTTNSYDEYIPKWVRDNLIEKQKPKVEFSDPYAEMSISKNTSNYLEFAITAKEKGLVRINTIYYPGWRVYVNGQEKSINKDNGLIEFSVNKGTSRVVSRFQETPHRLVSDLGTLTTIGIVSYLLVKYRGAWRRYSLHC